MTSKHLSIQVDESIQKRLDAESERLGQTREHLAAMLLDEGLRMLAHPGVVSRSGPVGRRPGLACGADIWEIARVTRELAGTSDTWVDQATELTSVPPHRVLIVHRYYTEYQDEIDEWIRRNDEEAERAEAEWLRERALSKS